MDSIAVTGKIRKSGIPATTVSFGAAGNQAVASANTHTLTIFTKIDKKPMADTAEGRDNDNEVVEKRRSNKRMQLSFSATPIGANIAAAQAIAADCPLIDDVVVITCADDAQVAVTAAYVQDAQVSYTPDNNVVIDFTVIEYPQTFVVAS